MPFVTKARKKNDPALRDPLAGLNKAERELYNIYIRALNKIQADLNDPNVLRAIREAIEAGNPQDASLALRWSSFITSLEKTVPQLARQLAASANVSAKSLPKKIQVNTNFENKDPRAIAWAQQRAGARIAGIRQESQKAVAEIVANGLRSQMTREQVIRQITEIVGLDSRQARALANFYEKNLQELLEDGLTFEQAERQALKLSKDYRQRLLVQRATRIARTETLAAANAGRMLSWQEADAQGLLPAGSMKRWKTATDERTCPTCGPLHNVSVSWEASFSTGDVMPPNHPNCRCTAVIVPAEPIFSQNIEKRYYRFADGEETWRNYDYRWRKIATELKRKVGKCQRCGSKSDLTVDHKKRLKDGGAKYDRKNLRVLCRSCNGKLARLGTKLRKSKNEWLFAKHLQGKHDQKRHGRGFGGGNTTQDLLVTQASKYETFEEFSRAISLYGLRPKVWHIAEADFELDPDYKPTNRLGGTSDESGLFVGDPETWQDYAVGRSNVIEFDVTDLSLTTKPLVDTSADYFPDQSGNQGFFIRPSAFPKLKEVKRMSLAEALNRAKKQQDSMPKSKTEAREIWDKSRTITKHAPGKHDQKTHGSWAGVGGLVTIGGDLLTEKQMKDFDTEIAKIPKSHWDALQQSGVKVRIMDTPEGAREKLEMAHFNVEANEIRLAKQEGAKHLLHEVGHALDYNSVEGKKSFLSDDKRLRPLIRESGFPTFESKSGSPYPYYRSEEFAIAYQNYFRSMDRGPWSETAKPVEPLKQLFDNIGDMLIEQKVEKHFPGKHDQKNHGRGGGSYGASESAMLALTDRDYRRAKNYNEEDDKGYLIYQEAYVDESKDDVLPTQIYDYAGTGYENINGYLRTQPKDVSEYPQSILELQNSIAVIDKGIEESPDVFGDKNLYRVFSNRTLENLNPGDTFIDKGFLSTTRADITLDKDTRINLGDISSSDDTVALILPSPSGQGKGLAVDWLLRASGYRDFSEHWSREQEVLLPRETPLLFLGFAEKAGIAQHLTYEAERVAIFQRQDK